MLDRSISDLPRTSAITIRRLNALGIKTFWDLVNYFPFRYKDYSKIYNSVGFFQAEVAVTVRGRVVDIKNVFTKKGSRFQKANIETETGTVELVWFNQYYLLNVIRAGMILSAAGTIKFFGNKKTILVEEYEILKDLSDIGVHTGRLVPVYSEKNGLSSKILRDKIYTVLTDIEIEDKFIPQKILDYNDLLKEADAYENIHFPAGWGLAKKARDRLAFDEIFVIRLSSELIRKKWQKDKVGNLITVDKFKGKIKSFIQTLPFKLTAAQSRGIAEIMGDLRKTTPMNRLLQGDVGSGKTVVAAVACFLTFLNKYKTLFMAPTGILADQHYKTLKKMFAHLQDIKIYLFTASSKPSNKELKSADIIVGTHALIAKKADFTNAGFVVIDEQHKFGVAQRGLLKDKVGNPHLLTMTATPIPRTVCLTLYGELDLSIIDEMPSGRMITKTYLVSPKKRADGYEWIKKQIRDFRTQVFIICPLIEESAVETMQSVKAVKAEYEYLKESVFLDFKLGLLHGKMKSAEKNKVMDDFKSGHLDILVSTSVVEVGVDIPNATIIVIEAAERFGLAQLHQLRGRVGRGDKQSYCLLFTTGEEEIATKRLRIFEKVHSGFELAEHDLKIRGAGDIYGTAQHGVANLKIASLSDTKLIEKASNAVKYFIKAGLKIESFSQLKKRLEDYQTDQISRD